MRAINNYFETLSRSAFERYGFAYGEIIAQWRAIVGNELAGVCAPERIRWPRRSGAHDRKNARLGGTLVIRAASGRALELQHMTMQIIERINRNYGYDAIVTIKIIQGELPKPRVRAQRPVTVADANTMNTLERRLCLIDDEALKDGLRRLGQAVLARSRPAS